MTAETVTYSTVAVTGTTVTVTNSNETLTDIIGTVTDHINPEPNVAIAYLLVFIFSLLMLYGLKNLGKSKIFNRKVSFRDEIDANKTQEVTLIKIRLF